MTTITLIGTTFLVVFAITSARYLVVAGGAWALGYWLFRSSWESRKIIARSPVLSDILWEIRHSASTLIVFAVIGSATVLAAHAGVTRIYERIDDYGWCWFWASLAAAIILHDTYFYWTHRLMHIPWVFRHVHWTHHHSRNPTPWASYSFSPTEALIEGSIFPLVVLVIPMHPAALSLFLIWQIVFNVIGHAGFEYHAQRFMASPLRFLFNTPTGHIMHHEAFVGNYGLYFNVWDRVMRTNNSNYEQRFRLVTSRHATVAVDMDTSSLGLPSIRRHQSERKVPTKDRLMDIEIAKAENGTVLVASTNRGNVQ